MKTAPKPVILAAGLLVVGAIVAATNWLTAGHIPVAARQLAQDFVQKLDAQQFAPAFELTVKQGDVGRTPAELAAISNRELCRTDRVAYTTPFQSNGNRLRRWFEGREVEMPQIDVEFSGQCLLRVSVRRMPGSTDTWRVFRIASHAG